MLIITRRIGEVLVINNSITVTVLGINGCQIRLGIDAPREIAVHRKEIQDRINAEGIIKVVETIGEDA